MQYHTKEDGTGCMGTPYGIRSMLELGLRKLEAKSDALQLVKLVNEGQYREFRTEPWTSLSKWIEKTGKLR